jgi:septal ring factor EnvC (AmiA/AmiB activator)
MLATHLRLKQLFCAAVVAVVTATGSFARDAGEAEQDLEALRERIQTLEEDIRDRTDKRSSAEQSLSEAERQESSVRKKLTAVNQELSASRARINQLKQQSDQQRAALRNHRADLSRQLRMAYIAGDEQWFQAVLSQHDPVQIGRKLVYYSYFAEQRTALISVVGDQLAALNATINLANEERNRLRDIETTESEKLSELADVRADRNKALASINSGIAKSSDRVERLKADAEALEALVAELTLYLSDLPTGDAGPFSEQKGRLPWPATGRVVRKYGQSKADGRLRWEGVLLGADSGVPVRAVHHGRVVFSDWLPGMGLLVIVEHGGGYLSLYGHNQDLAAAVGDWVGPETVIAHVGDSGGQAVAGLYFEIRKEGKPINPATWFGAQ